MQPGKELTTPGGNKLLGRRQPELRALLLAVAITPDLSELLRGLSISVASTGPRSNVERLITFRTRWSLYA